MKDSQEKEWEVTNTPITSYKNRRKLMTQQKLLSKSQSGNTNVTDSTTDGGILSGSGIGNAISASFTKIGGSFAGNQEENNDSGFLNNLAFNKNDEKDLEQ